MFQSAVRILGFPKLICSDISIVLILCFNPPCGFSASQSTTMPETLTCGYCVSIRRADSRLPKVCAGAVDARRCGSFNPPCGFSASQSPIFSTALEGCAKHKIGVAERRSFANRRHLNLSNDASLSIGVAMCHPCANCCRTAAPRRRRVSIRRRQRSPDAVG
jgi:hypothetical protein